MCLTLSEKKMPSWWLRPLPRGSESVARAQATLQDCPWLPLSSIWRQCRSSIWVVALFTSKRKVIHGSGPGTVDFGGLMISSIFKFQAWLGVHWHGRWRPRAWAWGPLALQWGVFRIYRPATSSKRSADVHRFDVASFPYHDVYSGYFCESGY